MTTEVTAFDLGHYLTQEGERVERALERALDRLLPAFAEPLRAPTRHGAMTGGKRLRPILCVAAYRSVGGGDREEAYDLSVSLELIHAYSLMHDDLPCMDDADLRRGQPTPHRLFGEAATARAGLALIPAAGLNALRAARALGCDEDRCRSIVRELGRAAGAGGMVGGQALDLLGEGEQLSSAGLDELHARKTGALLAASLTIGALAGGADDETRESLAAYGRAIGLAFQVTDDILDATSTVAELGKEPSDADLEKSTYVSLYGLDEARGRAAALVSAALSALDERAISAPALKALARYIVERKK